MVPKQRVASKILFQIDVDDDGTFVNFGCLRDIQSPGLNRNGVDVTCLEDDFDREEPGPTIDPGDITGTLFWDEAAADHQAVEDIAWRLSSAEPGPIVPMRVILPWAPTAGEYTALTFNGWFKTLGAVQMTVKTEITRSVTIDVQERAVRTTGLPAAFGL